MVGFHNTNSLVSNPTWNIIVQKTGYITEAGRCLVMQTVIEGRTVVIVLLNSFGKRTRTADATPHPEVDGSEAPRERLLRGGQQDLIFGGRPSGCPTDGVGAHSRGALLRPTLWRGLPPAPPHHPDVDRLGLRIEDDLCLTALELPHHVGELLIQRKILLPVLRSLAEHEGFHDTAERILGQLGVRNHDWFRRRVAV